MKTSLLRLILVLLIVSANLSINAQTLTIDHATQGAFDSELSVALSTTGIIAADVQTLIITGVNINMLDAAAIKKCINVQEIDLSSITFFNNVMDGNDAGGLFAGLTKLKLVTLPASVTQIGKGAFRGCTALTTLLIKKDDQMINFFSQENQQISVINSLAFFGCSQLPITELPGSLTNIGKQAFQGCSLLDIKGVIGFTNPKLQESLFRETALTDFTIPECVTSLDKTVFYNATGSFTRTITARQPLLELPSGGGDNYRNVFGSATSIGNTTLKVLKKHIDTYNAMGIVGLTITELDQTIHLDIEGQGRVHVSGTGLKSGEGYVAHGDDVIAYEAENITFAITPADNYELKFASLDDLSIVSGQELTIDSKPTKRLRISFQTTVGLQQEPEEAISVIHTHGTLILQGATNSPAQLFDLFGAKVVETTDGTIDISSLSKGIYILKIKNKITKIINK